MSPPTQEQIEAIKQWDVPTIANAIETFKVQPRTEGFCDTSIRCLYPQMGRMIGFAVTARASALAHDSGGQASPMDHFAAVQAIPGPRVAVVEDLDPPPRQAALFGEVNSNLHRALGCVGLVTNGAVRDLDEVEALGFHYFARSVCVAHAYVHYVAAGGVVNVGGLEVCPGDLIYGDKHGVLKIPLEIVADLPKACEELVRRERVIIDFAASDEFDAAKLPEIQKKAARGDY